MSETTRDEYIVWYWMSGELHRIFCGRDSKYAWALVESHMAVFYNTWLEYRRV